MTAKRYSYQVKPNRAKGVYYAKEFALTVRQGALDILVNMDEHNMVGTITAEDARILGALLFRAAAEVEKNEDKATK